MADTLTVQLGLGGARTLAKTRARGLVAARTKVVAHARAVAQAVRACRGLGRGRQRSGADSRGRAQIPACFRNRMARV